jgi:hypothetical protein
MIIENIRFVLTHLAQGTGVPMGQREPQERRRNGGLTHTQFALLQTHDCMSATAVLPGEAYPSDEYCFSFDGQRNTVTDTGGQNTHSLYISSTPQYKSRVL